MTEVEAALLWLHDMGGTIDFGTADALGLRGGRDQTGRSMRICVEMHPPGYEKSFRIATFPTWGRDGTTFEQVLVESIKAIRKQRDARLQACEWITSGELEERWAAADGGFQAYVLHEHAAHLRTTEVA